MADNPNPRNSAQETAKNADNKDAAAPSAAAAAQPAKSGVKQWLLAMAVLMGMVIGSASAAVVVASVLVRKAPAHAEPTAAADKAEPSGEKEKKVCELTTDNNLIVNVYQTQQRRCLVVKPVLVFDNTKTRDHVKESKMVEMQHLMIGILKSKTLEQLDAPDAPSAIGREIQETVNLKLNLNNAITSVYFTQFVVQ